MTSTSIDGFVDVLETDLRRLAHDARQTEGLASFFSSSNNAPQVVEATERAIDALRRTSDRSLEGGEQSILASIWSASSLWSLYGPALRLFRLFFANMGHLDSYLQEFLRSFIFLITNGTGLDWDFACWADLHSFFFIVQRSMKESMRSTRMKFNDVKHSRSFFNDYYPFRHVG